MAHRNSIERSKTFRGEDIIRGTDGDDKLYGGAGNDWLYGEEGDDYLDGGEGRDHLEGGEGDDQLYGGEGRDRLYGDPGDDELYGGAEKDALYGYEGNDRLYGGAGDDHLDGMTGDDELYGGAGNDWLYGYYGNDTVSGQEGNDWLYGQEGNDHLYGGAGNDSLEGGEGNDYLEGGEGIIDWLYGGNGNDILYGGAGSDWLTGGTGTDIFRSHRGDSFDTITDFTVAGANRDVLDLRAFNIDYTRDLESQGLTLSGLISAGLDKWGWVDDAANDRRITLPDGGIITLLDVGGAALAIDDFTFVGDDGALINVDADDEPKDQPGPDPEGQPGPEPGGNGGALTNVDADDGAGVPSWRSHLQEVVTSGGLTGRLDAGDLSIGGGVDLPTSDDGLHRSSYHLYYRADGGSYFLRFDDAITADLPVGATAAQVAAALEGLDGVTSAEVTGEPGDFTIALTADEPHVLQWGDLRLDGDGQLDYLAEPPADDGDGGALTNVDAGDEPEDQPGPDPEGQPDPDPEGNGGALTNVEAGDEPGGLTPPEPEARVVEGAAPQKSILQQHLNLLKLITGGASGSLDAGALSIWGGADLPASDDGLHRSNYHLYYRADGGSYFLRFDDAVTADLPVGATAAQVDAALEGLDGVTSAEVSGEPGNFTIALTADEPHVLQWGDLNLAGDGSLDYLIA